MLKEREIVLRKRQLRVRSDDGVLKTLNRKRKLKNRRSETETQGLTYKYEEGRQKWNGEGRDGF